MINEKMTDHCTLHW